MWNENWQRAPIKFDLYVPDDYENPSDSTDMKIVIKYPENIHYEAPSGNERF